MLIFLITVIEKSKNKRLKTGESSIQSTKIALLNIKKELFAEIFL